MNDVSLIDMMIRGWPVLSVLLLMSIFSVTIIVDRVRLIRRFQVNERSFMARLLRLHAEQGRGPALEFCRKYDFPIAAVSAEVLSQAGGREAKERAMQHGMQAQVRKLESMVPVLGTVAGTAPFVGLFGTVIGIIKAFASIAANSGGGPEVVSAGIAEALITTACGLVVAIPALIGYNYCIHMTEVLMTDVELLVFDLIEVLCPETKGEGRPA
ncbi:MAG: MotA/TolQ/ExbB proton channel family protein [bacterium]